MCDRIGCRLSEGVMDSCLATVSVLRSCSGDCVGSVLACWPPSVVAARGLEEARFRLDLHVLSGVRAFDSVMGRSLLGFGFGFRFRFACGQGGGRSVCGEYCARYVWCPHGQEGILLGEAILECTSLPCGWDC
jgi:hypothetical protein